MGRRLAPVSAAVLLLAASPLPAFDNNGFETDWVYALRTYTGELSAYRESDGAIMDTLIPPFPGYPSPNRLSETCYDAWESLTFAGTPANNDARLFVAKVTPRQDPDCGPQHAKDVVIIEIGPQGCSYDGTGALNAVRLSTLLGAAQVGPYVRLGTLRYSSFHDALLVSIDKDYRNDTLPVHIYEIDLALTTIRNTYTGANVHNDEPSMDVDPVSGVLYVCEPNMGQPDGDVVPRNRQGDLISIDTSGGSTGSFVTLIDGPTCGAADGRWLGPQCPVYRGTVNPSGRPSLVVLLNESIATNHALEFYLDANDGAYPPAGNLVNRSEPFMPQRGAWRGQLDEVTGTVMATRLFDGTAGIDLLAPDDSTRRIANAYGFVDTDSPGARTWTPAPEPAGTPRIDLSDPYRFLMHGKAWYPVGYYPALGALTLRWDGVALDTYYRTLLDKLAANGINYCRLVFSMGVAANWGNMPLTMPYVVVGTINKNGNIFGRVDLDRFNQAHFDYWRNVIQYARDKGIVVQLCILDSWHIRISEPPWWGVEHDVHAPGMNVNGLAVATADEWHTTNTAAAIWQKHTAMIEEVVDQLGDLPNIVWEIANEPRKYYDNNNYGDLIDKEGTPIADWAERLGLHLKAYEFSTRGGNHICMPVDLHDHQKTPGQRFNWRIGFSDCHTPSGVHRDLLHIRQLTGGGDSRFPARPMISDNDGNGDLDANDRRRKAWACLTAGAHIDYFHFDIHEYSTLLGSSVSDGMKYIGYTNKFINDLKVSLRGMIPRDDLVTNGWCLARPADEYVVYLISGGSTTAPNLPASYTAMWFNPRSGVTQSAGSGPTFNAPDSNDWVLHVVDPRSSGQAPFHGIPGAIPGTIEAEDYDLGGQGTAYQDGTAGNAGGAYRSDDVDISTCSDGAGCYSVGWAAAGEWLEYTVNVATNGCYDIAVRVATPGSGTTFRIELDGIALAGSVNVPNTGGWGTFQTVTIEDVMLAAGTDRVLRFVHETGGFNTNWIRFTLRAAIVASDFDGDGDVDQEDFGYFQTCYSGTGVPYGPGCAAADLSGNGAVDQHDTDIFRACMSGPNVPVDPACPD